MARISAVMVCRNEERFLDLAIKSVKTWVDEVLVADMRSADGSVAIAEQLGARVIAIEPAPAVEMVRESVIARAAGDWILLVDPDEVVSPTLALTLRAIADGDTSDAVELKRATYIAGHRMRGTGWEPKHESHIRMFRPQAVELEPRVHAVISVRAGFSKATLSESDGMLHHLNYVGWDQFVEKLNRYTTLDAEYRFRTGAKSGLTTLLRGIGAEILYRGIRGRAWRDGWYGLVLILNMISSHVIAYTKYRQLAKYGDATEVSTRYRQEMAAMLAEGNTR